MSRLSQDNGSNNKENNWDKKRKYIKSNVQEGIRYRENMLSDISNVRNNLGKSSEQIGDELVRLRTLDEIYKSPIKVDLNPVVEGSIDRLVYYSEMDVQRWSNFNNQWAPLRNQVNLFNAGITASGTLVPSMASGSMIIAERIEPLSHSYQYTERLNTPTPLDRKRDLSEKLVKINPLFSGRIEGAWHAFNDPSNADRISQAATSFRELLTNILSEFAPHEKVKDAFWFKSETNDGSPTRRQRIRYSLMGNNKEIEGKVFESLTELIDNLFDEFDKLNKLTHLQKYESDLEKRTEDIMIQCQIHLLKLLDLREQYFK
jgi:hypothetical protein